MNTIELIDRLEQDKSLQKEEWIHVIEDDSEENRKYAAEKARALGDTYYGKEIFVRGLIEFTNYCKNDCYYCGIRCSNSNANRYPTARRGHSGMLRRGRSPGLSDVCAARRRGSILHR